MSKAFREWRRDSEFLPTIADIRRLLLTDDMTYGEQKKRAEALEQKENWIRIEQYKREHGGLTPMQIWVKEHAADLKALSEKMRLG